MYHKLLEVTCLFALMSYSRAGDPLEGLVYAPAHSSIEYYAYPSYAFDYSVNDPVTGDNKAQWEKRDGDVVKGAYSLVEPDGSLRIVEYWADDESGFNAVVKRIGPNRHPTVLPPPPGNHIPVYRAPIPLLPASRPIKPIPVGQVAKHGGLASAPIYVKPLTASFYPKANLPHPAPILYRPIQIVKPAAAVAPVTPIIPLAPIPMHGGIIKAPFPYPPINVYSDLEFIDGKGPLLNAWYKPNSIFKYTY